MVYNSSLWYKTVQGLNGYMIKWVQSTKKKIQSSEIFPNKIKAKKGEDGTTEENIHVLGAK